VLDVVLAVKVISGSLVGEPDAEGDGWEEREGLAE